MFWKPKEWRNVISVLFPCAWRESVSAIWQISVFYFSVHLIKQSILLISNGLINSFLILFTKVRLPDEQSQGVHRHVQQEDDYSTSKNLLWCWCHRWAGKIQHEVMMKSISAPRTAAGSLLHTSERPAAHPLPSPCRGLDPPSLPDRSWMVGSAAVTLGVFHEVTHLFMYNLMRSFVNRKTFHFPSLDAMDKIKVDGLGQKYLKNVAN